MKTPVDLQYAPASPDPPTPTSASNTRSTLQNIGYGIFGNVLTFTGQWESTN